MVKELVPLARSYDDMRRALRERNGPTPREAEAIGEVPRRATPPETPAAPVAMMAPMAMPVPETSSLPASLTSPRAPTLKCVMRIPYPAPGTNPGFDRIARIYGEKEAVRLVFGRAFERWIEGFPQAASTMSPTARYPVTKSKVYKAGRAIEARIIDEVRARLDPYGLRKVGWLAQAIGLAAMSDEMDRLRNETATGEKSEAYPRKSER